MNTKNKKNILITGGCGYIGTKLTEILLNQKFNVTILDTRWFGSTFKKEKNLKLIKMNVSEIEKLNLSRFYSIIHLANIANDPAAELSPKLTWEVNVLFLNKLILHAIKYKVKKFIYASSGSVYGLKKEKRVSENLSLVPISDYNKSKMIAERVLESYSNKIKIYSVRPATVCGFSKNMRLDISVNMFVYQALIKKKIYVIGGNQVRPNIYISDLCRVFIHFLKKNLKPGAYNAGFENLKIKNLAKKISKKTNCKIIFIKKTNDPRSYRQDSTKLLKTRFKPKFNVDFAIDELIEKFRNNKIKVTKKLFRVGYMKKFVL